MTAQSLQAVTHRGDDLVPTVGWMQVTVPALASLSCPPGCVAASCGPLAGPALSLVSRLSRFTWAELRGAGASSLTEKEGG